VYGIMIFWALAMFNSSTIWRLGELVPGFPTTCVMAAFLLSEDSDGGVVS
jgi:hypothetical protein